MNPQQPISKQDEIPPAMPLAAFLLTLVAAAGGAMAAILNFACLAARHGGFTGG